MDHRHSFALLLQELLKTGQDFALRVQGGGQGHFEGQVTKFGEWPPFGPSTPARFVSLIGPDRDLFLKGRRSESQGLGIGAFAYYRRVVENNKARLIDAIANVGKHTGLSSDDITKLETAKGEIQFSKAIDSIKTLIPNELFVAGGHPFKGKRSHTPHSGAHIHFGNAYQQWPKGGTAPSNYPPIYAVADGIISRVTPSLHVGMNDRYGINLAIAREGDAVWSLEYSIEPFVVEPSPGFYRRFIKVEEGTRVIKGQAIGFMYLSEEGANGSHIHFELISDQRPRMKAPAIFTAKLTRQFHDRWGGGVKDGPVTIPACMGWKLAEDENPFAAEAADCLQ
jgi:hypothetical protein